jgi:hypothetical protein
MSIIDRPITNKPKQNPNNNNNNNNKIHHWIVTKILEIMHSSPFGMLI